MKVKQVKEIDLKANDIYTIPLNSFKIGDTVARELIISCDGSCTLTADDSEPFGIDAQLNVDAYTGEGGVALIPCDLFKEIQVQVFEDCTLSYKVLV